MAKPVPGPGGPACVALALVVAGVLALAAWVASDPPGAPAPAAPAAPGPAPEVSGAVAIPRPQPPSAPGAVAARATPPADAAPAPDSGRDPVAQAIERLRVLRPELGELTREELLALEELDLRDTDVTDEDLRHLRELPALVRLNLRGTAVGDAGLAHLQGLALETLELRGTQVTGAGLWQLPWRLRHLDLTSTRLEPGDLYGLPGLPALAKLDLNFLALDDSAIEPLSRLPSLRHLECDRSSISAEGVERLLQANPLLTRLELRDTPILPDEASSLMDRYPGCELVVENPALTRLQFGR